MVESRRTSRELTLSAAAQAAAVSSRRIGAVRLNIGCYGSTIEGADKEAA
jgi:hypothetical protein